MAFETFIFEHARALGAYMQAQLRTPAESEMEMAERYGTPEAIMRETAIALGTKIRGAPSMRTPPRTKFP